MKQTYSRQRTCCFFGHREISNTKELNQQLYSIIENLVLEKHVDTFLFGSRSNFDSMCYEQVTKIKEKYPHIKRIYVRAEFPQINESYESYLLKHYEHTYYPERAVGAGRAVYIQRNREMIDNSNFCVIYYDENYLPTKKSQNESIACGRSKSGTELAYIYAKQKGLWIKNLFDN